MCLTGFPYLIPDFMILYFLTLPYKKWQLTPVLLPGKPHGQRRLVGYSIRGHKESDVTEWLHLHTVDKEAEKYIHGKRKTYMLTISSTQHGDLRKSLDLILSLSLKSKLKQYYIFPKKKLTFVFSVFCLCAYDHQKWVMEK